MSDTQTTPFVNTPEILYRLRAANGDLLYVGITRDFPTRLKQHSADKGWYDEVRQIELVYVDGTRRQIEAIERAVIKAEQPRFNKQHNVPEGRVQLGARAVRPVVVEEDAPFKVGDHVRLRGGHTWGDIVKRERSINYVQFPGQEYPWACCDSEIMAAPTGPLNTQERRALAIEFGDHGPEWYCWAGVGYEPGWIIEHPEYGEGRVIDCDSDPIHGDVHVAFDGDSVEVRHLSIQWCPLRTVAK